MSASSSDRVVTRKLTDSQVDCLLTKLIAELPHTIPLTRRIQFESRHPSPTAQVVLATHDDGADALSLGAGADTDEKIAWLIAPRAAWLAAYIDLANPGQTQGWLFASWELPDSKRNPLLEQSLVDALFKYIYDTLVPLQPTEPSAEWLRLRETGKYLSQPYDRNQVLFGTVHDSVRQYIRTKSIKRVDASYGKWIFDVPSTLTSGPMLPDGYAFGDMTEDLLQTVLDRTPIPRTLQTLKSMRNVGLYHKGQATGWGFVSKDGSVASLHTEPQHRGQGLAVAIGRELMRNQSELFGNAGTKYSHADVSDDNAASISVMKKLGGKVMWRVAWVVVDLSEALAGEQAVSK